MDFRGAGSDEHALANLAVGEANGDVAHDLEFGRGEAVPTVCGALSFAAGPADIADRLIGSRCSQGRVQGARCGSDERDGDAAYQSLSGRYSFFS